jgi:hypothetical protein
MPQSSSDDLHYTFSQRLCTHPALRYTEQQAEVMALPTIRKQLQHPGQPAVPTEKQPQSVAKPIEPTCPCCKKGLMQHVMDFGFREPPPLYLLKELLKDCINPAMSKMAV